jgi:hypothetical protein
VAELENGGREAKYDPFGKDVQQAQLIVSMKIYDVLLAMLGEMNEKAGKDLDILHSNGVIAGLGPQFSHFFNRDDEADAALLRESQPDNLGDAH